MSNSERTGAHEAAHTVLKLEAEELSVGRRSVDRGIVRVRLETTHQRVDVDELVSHERIEIERVAIGREVEVAPPTREEGDLTIIPVMAEIVVVTRKLVLKEEVRLRRVQTTEPHRETVDLRVQEAVITRATAEPGSAPGGPDNTTQEEET